MLVLKINLETWEVKIYSAFVRKMAHMAKSCATQEFLQLSDLGRYENTYLKKKIRKKKGMANLHLEMAWGT